MFFRWHKVRILPVLMRRYFLLLVHIGTCPLCLKISYRPWLFIQTTIPCPFSRTSSEQLKYNIKTCWGNATKSALNQTGVYNDTYGLSDFEYFKWTVGNVSDDCPTLTQNYVVDEDDATRRVNTPFHLSVYAGLVLAVFLLSLVRTTSFFYMCMKASRTLHNKMFRSVLRSPVSFFDSNPVGECLNWIFALILIDCEFVCCKAKADFTWEMERPSREPEAIVSGGIIGLPTIIEWPISPPTIGLCFDDKEAMNLMTKRLTIHKISYHIHMWKYSVLGWISVFSK